ncbi:Hypothetical predicted protein [Prunus dulcis]|uniref:Uncharacterized protein n=1 Tax=Prunus dulcis TaxID=3755 RepID=A0A5E4GHK7_PRUDU|nr:Hypothetical predicted protein [Prunus dulcis]
MWPYREGRADLLEVVEESASAFGWRLGVAFGQACSVPYPYYLPNSRLFGIVVLLTEPFCRAVTNARKMSETLKMCLLMGAKAKKQQQQQASPSGSSRGRSARGAGGEGGEGGRAGSPPPLPEVIAEEMIEDYEGEDAHVAAEGVGRAAVVNASVGSRGADEAAA